MEYCFINFGLFPMVLLTIFFTVISIYMIYLSFKGRKRVVWYGAGFLLVSLVSLFYIPCWSFLVGIVEIAVAVLMYKEMLRILV